MSYSNLREHVRQHPSVADGTAIAQIWTAEDVTSLNDALTLDDARDVLGIVNRNFDASIGINWDTISDAIDEFLRKDD